MIRVASKKRLHWHSFTEAIYEDKDYERALEKFLRLFDIFPDYINHISWRLGRKGHWRHIASCPIMEHLLKCYIDMYRMEKGKAPYFFKE
jgi:hypothetical protein